MRPKNERDQSDGGTRATHRLGLGPLGSWVLTLFGLAANTKLLLRAPLLRAPLRAPLLRAPLRAPLLRAPLLRAPLLRAAPILLALLVHAPARSHAERATPSTPPAIELAGLAPPPGDDAREAIALGPAGQVFAPNAAGGWLREQPTTIADRISVIGRAGGQVVALGGGVAFRLAPNGWTAIRIILKGKTIISAGRQSVAAVGRQLYAIDKAALGEPTKLALTPSAVLAIGSGKGTVIALDRGLFRVDGARLTAIKRVPRRVDRLISDRWALVSNGAVDLRSGVTTPWPSGLSIATAASGPSEGLVAVGVVSSGGAKRLELVTLSGKKLVRDPVPEGITGTAVGVALDSFGRAVIALRDGRMALREGGVWSVVSVLEALPAAQPGAPPATSP